MRKILLILAMILAPVMALASSVPYEVRQVMVTVVAAEGGAIAPASARQQAIDLAADKGLRQLLQLITPEASWPKHHELLAQIVPRAFVERFSIVQETNRTPYTLVADLYFNRDMVRALLADNALPFIDTKQEVILVVPVFVVGENAQLFEQDNPWGGALQMALSGPQLAQLNLPPGDYEDMMTLTPEMALLGVAESVEALGQRHEADMVLVSVAKIISSGGQRLLQVQSQWYGGRGVQPISFEMAIPEAKQAEVLQQAAKKLIQAVDNQWRAENTVAVDKPQSLVAFLSVNSLETLENLIKKLNDLAAVQQAFLRSLTKREAYIQIDYYGEGDNLTETLRNNGLYLTSQDGRWLLSTERGTTGQASAADVPGAVDVSQTHLTTDTQEVAE